MSTCPNGVERRTWHPLGWPRAGALVHGSQGPMIPIDCGNGEVIWVGDPDWARQFATFLNAAANQLEAMGARRHPYAEPQVESTAVIDAVTDPEPGDRLVHPATTPAQETPDA
jgi:hypothetical protein